MLQACFNVLFVSVVLSYDGILLVAQSVDSLPKELESLKDPLQDYGAVSLNNAFILSHK